MPDFDAYIGRLTNEQTVELAKAALSNITVDQVAELLKDLYGPDDMDELVSQLSD